MGDWLLIDRESGAPERVLRRKSLFKRRAAGTGRRVQLIAANVDTLFIVTSCNQDFNVARLERYLALAREADVTPVIVLTKADLADDCARLRRPRGEADAGPAGRVPRRARRRRRRRTSSRGAERARPWRWSARRASASRRWSTR